MFNEKNIVLAFAAMSDVHITAETYYDSQDKLRNAIDYNNEIAKRDGVKLDAFCFCGDMLDRGWESQAKMFSDIMLEKIQDDQKIFYAIGNHEHLSSPGAEVTLKFVRLDLGEKYFEDDLETKEEYDLGLRKMRIKDYLFIAIQAESWYAPGPNKYTKRRLDFLEDALKEESIKNPGKYVFVFNHSMAYGTCYGSDLDGPDSMWNTTELTPILSKYPNAILIGGHLHFPLNDERTIMQDTFTAIGDGCVTYMAIENGGYEYMINRTVMRDRLEFSQNLIFELDDVGNCRIRRIDCYNKDEIKIPWDLDAPDKEKNHLKKYTSERGNKENNNVPSMNGHAYLGERLEEDKKIVTLTFDSGCDDDFVHRYIITYFVDGEKAGEKRILADFYKHPHPKDMKKSYTLDLCEKEVGKTYSAEVYCIDSWNAESNTIKAE